MSLVKGAFGYEFIHFNRKKICILLVMLSQHFQIQFSGSLKMDFTWWWCYISLSSPVSLAMESDVVILDVEAEVLPLYILSKKNSSLSDKSLSCSFWPTFFLGVALRGLYISPRLLQKSPSSILHSSEHFLCQRVEKNPLELPSLPSFDAVL
ncbi:hypothetical protein HJG60_011220 [Phyllostomus discolor]|uniref:Uncharacterized protein n=1 Tax=Phyllostomus discolor TaxID=89673 RepID=A0A834A3P0_9CHIR|nr:hypothetical protein HJG60_011220 [Phyllostomus discolor]